MLSEYQQHFENALMDINNQNISNVLASNRNTGYTGSGDSVYSQGNQNVFGDSDTLKSPEELGFKSTIEQLDKNNPSNEEVRHGYVKQSGFNKAMNDSFKDVSDNMKKINNKVYEEK
ncbi:hypothetical protein ACPEER_05305 [Pasteurella sp. PK-2025]|uniref:hypothetical protein n=1 Tax=Pasteurella sp. PK-2025 TaxID=3413133 RepID=UPI003C707F4F